MQVGFRISGDKDEHIYKGVGLGISKWERHCRCMLAKALSSDPHAHLFPLSISGQFSAPNAHRKERKGEWESEL